MGTFFVWFLLCSGADMTGNCSLVKLSSRMELAECWSKAAKKQDLLIKSNIRNYKLWCSDRDYIKESKNERRI